jgi:hypothetical protein
MGTSIAPPDTFETDSSRLRSAADISKLITPRDDSELGRLLRDSFDIFARQFEPSESMDIVSKGDPAQKIPPLHGRLTFIYHDENDRERQSASARSSTPTLSRFRHAYGRH